MSQSGGQSLEAPSYFFCITYPCLPSQITRSLKWELSGLRLIEQAPGGLACERLEGGALHLCERLQDAIAQRAQVEQHAHLQ